MNAPSPRPTLVLFDVDGTLLLSGGAGARAMQEAGKRVVGPHFTLETVAFAGRLDPLIWGDGARRAGVAGDDGLHVRFRAAYREALERRLETERCAHLLPGVAALLGRLRREPGVSLGLVTGNYPETGRLKLEAAGLDPATFAFPVWGVDGPTRRDLPRVARERYAAVRGTEIPPERVVVVGDTVHDVDCAHANGCRALAVASGPAYTLDDLRATDPDLLVEDLRDTEALVAWIVSPSSPYAS